MTSEAPTHWRTIPMGHASSLKGRLGWQGLKAAHYRQSGPYVVSSAHFDRERIRWDLCPRVTEQRYAADTNIQLREGDVLLMKDGAALGKIAYVDALPGPACLNSHLLLFRPLNDAYDPRFLFYTLGSDAFQRYIQVHANGLTFLGISQKAVARFPLRLPPLREQELISAVLASVDDTVRKTDLLIAKLRQLRHGLTHDLLTRGVDDNGKLRDPKRDPGHFKDSSLGKIPRAWNVEPLGAVAELVTSGSRGWAAYYADRGPLFIRIGNLTREHINLRLENVQHVRPPATTEGKRTALRAGDVLISITADLGIVGAVPDDLGEAYVNQHIALVRIPGDRANSRWVAHWIAAPGGQRQVRKLDDTGAKAGLNLPTVKALLCPLAPRAEQDELTRRLDAMDARIVREECLRAKLRLIKAGLGDDLLTGRVRVTKVLDGAAE